MTVNVILPGLTSSSPGCDIWVIVEVVVSFVSNTSTCDKVYILSLFFSSKPQIIREPAGDEGALDAFVSIITGPPGPNPVQLMPKISSPVLLLWGNQDPFTPLDGPVGKYFTFLAADQENISLYALEGVGHCPHDDRPELVHAKLLPWLLQLPALDHVWSVNSCLPHEHHGYARIVWLHFLCLKGKIGMFSC